MNPAITIAAVVAIAVLTYRYGARRLDAIEQQQNHEYELRDAKARAIRAELDLLNDGSWQAFWQEHDQQIEERYAALVAAASWELHGTPDDVIPGLVWSAA